MKLASFIGLPASIGCRLPQLVRTPGAGFRCESQLLSGGERYNEMPKAGIDMFSELELVTVEVKVQYIAVR